MPTAFQDSIALSAEIAARVRLDQPRIHCLTNTVAEPITANALLALGAIPSMTSFAPELPDFLAEARGVMVNIGTPSEEKASARLLAVQIARHREIPWVLDPVMAHWSVTRRGEAETLLRYQPRVLRANAQEIAVLSGALGRYLGVQAITAPSDHIMQGARRATIDGGTPLLAQVTATGCALSAVVTAFCACHEDPFEASLAACAVFKAAGGLAATKSDGPGTFAMHLMDALAAVDADTLSTHLTSLEREGESAA